MDCGRIRFSLHCVITNDARRPKYVDIVADNVETDIVDFLWPTLEAVVECLHYLNIGEARNRVNPREPVGVKVSVHSAPTGGVKRSTATLDRVHRSQSAKSRANDSSIKTSLRKPNPA